MKRKVKVVITGYYDVDMSTAEEFYDTTDPDKMLKIDTKGLSEVITLSEVADFLEGEIKVYLSWEN